MGMARMGYCRNFAISEMSCECKRLLTTVDGSNRAEWPRLDLHFVLLSCLHINRNATTAHVMATAKVMGIQVTKPSRVRITPVIC